MSRRRSRRPVQQHAQDTLPGTDRAGATTNHTGQPAPTEPTTNGVGHAQEPDHGPVADTPGRSATPAAPGPQTGAQPAQDEEPGQDHGPVWSASEAARRCGVPRTSLTRMLQRGGIPGATKDDDGHWSIPLSALLAAGLSPAAPAPGGEDDDQEPEGPTLAEELAAAREQIATLRVELAEAEGRARTFEKVAEERASRLDEQAAYIHDLRGPIFRALAPEPAQPVHLAATQVSAPTQPDQQPKPAPGMAGRLKKWWRG